MRGSILKPSVGVTIVRSSLKDPSVGGGVTLGHPKIQEDLPISSSDVGSYPIAEAIREILPQPSGRRKPIPNVVCTHMICAYIYTILCPAPIIKKMKKNKNKKQIGAR